MVVVVTGITCACTSNTSAIAIAIAIAIGIALVSIIAVVAAATVTNIVVISADVIVEMTSTWSTTITVCSHTRCRTGMRALAVVLVPRFVHTTRHLICYRRRRR